MMKARKKICEGCNSEQYIWKNHKGNKYCKFCWGNIKYNNTPPKYKPKTPIANKSKKQIILDKSYTQLRKPFMLKYPMCQAALIGCMQSATDVHHKKGRGPYLLVVSTWMSVCRKCHNWIEEHPEEATEMGFRESKLTDL